MTAAVKQSTFYGWRVVAASFVLAVFGWGLGFYGPPIYLHAVEEARGWPLALVSTAVTVHFLVGAVFTANLPQLYGRFGVPAITKAGAVSQIKDSSEELSASIQELAGAASEVMAPVEQINKAEQLQSKSKNAPGTIHSSGELGKQTR